VNNHQNPPPDGDTDSAWESAMSRDFDARVRDLHEAPLSFDSVVGKARTIRRNRRIAVAGGVLAVAAVITPVAVIASTNDGDADSRPPIASQDVEEPTTASQPDYIADGTWHQADGDEVAIPDGDYYAAATIWDEQLVLQRPATTDVSNSVTEIIDADGNVVDSFETNQGIAVNDDSTTFAYISADGELITRWADGEVAIADGFADNESPATVTGGPDCNETADGCIVYVNDGGPEGHVQAFDSHGVNDSPVEQFLKVSDARGTTVTVVDTVDEFAPESCGGLFDLEAGEFIFRSCDFTFQQISPDGEHVAAPPSYLDGFGAPELSIADAATGDETGRWSVDGGTAIDWAWSTDGRLVFTQYDGASWHLTAMEPEGGAIEELVKPVPGSDMDNPFLLIQH
jgi:hypothetical protein